MKNLVIWHGNQRLDIKCPDNAENVESVNIMGIPEHNKAYGAACWYMPFSREISISIFSEESADIYKDADLATITFFLIEKTDKA